MLIIRPETPEDKAAIYHVNQGAFGQKEEADLIEKLRNRGILAISLVAVLDNEIVGHIAFSPAQIDSEYSNFPVITLAPMAVLPAYQHQGIGSQLVQAGLEECRRLNHKIVVLVGHPDYYPRFGFIPAKPRGIDCEFKVPDEAWMLLELREDALTDMQGTVKFQPEFSETI